MKYRGHEIKLDHGRYQTYSPTQGYNGSFDTAAAARKWIREQIVARAALSAGVSPEEKP